MDAQKYASGAASRLATIAKVTPMKIVKRWRDDPDTLMAQGEPTDWFETKTDECLDHTEGAGYYKNSTVLKILAEGTVVSTPWADYMMVEVGQ